MTGWDKILIAIDGGETSNRAVQYVCKIAPLIDNVTVCLLHVYPEPPPDYFSQGGRVDKYKQSREKKAAEMLGEARTLLLESGVPEQGIVSQVLMAQGKTISQAVLDIQAEGGYGTVVAGKRGVSKAEEFLFGSISNTLARHSKDFTSWIVG